MRVYGTVNRSAILHNLSRVREKVANTSVMCVVKANAYGHGIMQVAKILQSKTDGFAVATVEEALELREMGIVKPICILSGFHEAEQLADIRSQKLEVVLYCDEQIKLLESEKEKWDSPVWVKINSGMNRLGFAPHEIHKVVERLNSMAFGMDSIRFMSHFACADEPEQYKTNEQLEIFFDSVYAYSSAKSIANSAGILAYPESHFDWVRPGIMLYGVSPFPHLPHTDFNLKPALDVYSTIVAVNEVRKGDSVGYGGVWTSPDTRRIGIVACGYGDGYPRNVPTGASVLIQENRASIVGRISMDTFAVDLSGHPSVSVGTKVKLFGNGLPVEEVATAAGTIPYELLVSVNPRAINII